MLKVVRPLSAGARTLDQVADAPKCTLGAFSCFVIYLLKYVLVTYSTLDTWELGPSDMRAYKASHG